MSRIVAAIVACVGIATVVMLATRGCDRETRSPEVLSPPVATIEGTVAITNVAVVDVDAGCVRAGQTVVVNGDRIAAVGPAATTRPAAGVTVIDGTGKFLLPGLWDMHAHIADPAMAAGFLRYGVTGVRHMYSLIAAVPVRASDPAAGGSGPRVVAATHLLDGTKTGFPWLLSANVRKADTPAEARLAVRKIRDSGNDFLKIGNALPRDAYFAAVAEAKALGMPVAGHVPFAVSAFDAVRAGQQTIEHLDGVAAASGIHSDRWWAQRAACAEDSDSNAAQSRVDLDSALDTPHPVKEKALFAAFVSKQVWHVPTLVQTQATSLLGIRTALPPAVEAELPEKARLFWDRKYPKPGEVILTAFGRKYTAAQLAARRQQYLGEQKLAGRLHRAGVKLLAGTDTPYPLVVPGYSLHQELELLVGAGLTPPEALRAATLDPARCLGREKHLGSVAVGKYADLILLTADPTRDIANTRAIEKVFVGGKMVPR